MVPDLVPNLLQYRVWMRLLLYEPFVFLYTALQFLEEIKHFCSVLIKKEVNKSIISWRVVVGMDSCYLETALSFRLGSVVLFVFHCDSSKGHSFLPPPLYISCYLLSHYQFNGCRSDILFYPRWIISNLRSVGFIWGFLRTDIGIPFPVIFHFW